ncbi:MAG: MgtC/SapB family protein [Ignavibacteriae bacterium]|nr:MgtC/SapB family protein [Ignavibacteriota bacterium]MCB9243518.1 MgtC/SapB family protein [Ignavibacteriales bacterium]
MISHLLIFLQVSIPTGYDTQKLIIGMLVSVGIGILIGLEREYSHKKEERTGSDNLLMAGIRTYPIITLLGYIIMFLSASLTIWLFFVTLVAVLVYVGMFYYRNSKLGHTGTTSEFSVVIAYLLGAMVYLDYTLLAVGIGVFLTITLAFKLRIHKAIGKLTEKDIHAIIQFVIMAALLLPLLPDEDYGPDGVLNPFKIGLIIVLLTGLNFVGYLLGKFINTGKSVILTGILGGFISSTAVTWHFSRQSKAGKGVPSYQAAAVIVASSIMFLRIAFLLYILNKELFEQSAAGMIIVAGIGIGIGYLIVRNSKVTHSERGIVSKNPLNLTEALKFGAVFVSILLLVGLAKEYIGTGAIYAVSAISGLTDVDAVVISMANLAGVNLAINVAFTGVIIAAASNTLVKYAMCLIFGKPELKKYASIGFIPVFLTFVLYVVIKRAFF